MKGHDDGHRTQLGRPKGRPSHQNQEYGLEDGPQISIRTKDDLKGEVVDRRTLKREQKQMLELQAQK